MHAAHPAVLRIATHCRELWRKPSASTARESRVRASGATGHRERGEDAAPCEGAARPIGDTVCQRKQAQTRTHTRSETGGASGNVNADPARIRERKEQKGGASSQDCPRACDPATHVVHYLTDSPGSLRYAEAPGHAPVDPHPQRRIPLGGGRSLGSVNSTTREVDAFPEVGHWSALTGESGGSAYLYQKSSVDFALGDGLMTSQAGLEPQAPPASGLPKPVLKSPGGRPAAAETSIATAAHTVPEPRAPSGPRGAGTSGASGRGAAVFSAEEMSGRLPLPYSSANLTPLIASRIGMPSRPGAVPLTTHMSDDHRARYEDPARILRQRMKGSGTRARRVRRGRVGGSKDEYISLIRRCVGVGMWGYYEGDGPPPAVNGVFAVKKDDAHDRLIVDARAANDCFVLPPAVALPTPDTVSELYISVAERSGERPDEPELFVAKTDLSDYYHQLRLPLWMTDYFCLPPVTRRDLYGEDSDALVYPKSLVLPMGWSHSVVAAQIVHETIAQRAGLLNRAPPIGRLFDGAVSHVRPRMQTYIDDVVFYGLDRDAVERLQADYIAAIHAAGLTIKQSKTISARSEPVKCVGIEVDGQRCTAGVAADDLRALITQTNDTLRDKRRAVSASEFSGLIGSWNWAMCVQRASMSVFQAVYGFARERHARGDRRPIWPSARRELQAICDLAPLLRVTLNPTVSHTAVAGDASSDGFGVSVAELASSAETRAAAAHTFSAHTLRLLAAARQPEEGEGRARARVILECEAANAELAASARPRPVHEQAQAQAQEVPCIAAAAAAERAGERLKDATEDGLRVTALPLNSRLHGFTSSYRRLVGGREWRVALSGKWTGSGAASRDTDRGPRDTRDPEHINCLELRTAGYALNWALRHVCPLDSRFLLLTDSTAALGALTKGRSSSFALLRCVRRVSATLLATGVRPLYRYVESEANPADRPSRSRLKRGTRLRVDLPRPECDRDCGARDAPHGAAPAPASGLAVDDRERWPGHSLRH